MFGKIFNNVKNSVLGNVKKYANKDFLDAVVSSCALVAMADGEATSDEKAKMLGYIQRNKELKMFNMSDVKSRFTYFVDSIEFDNMLGKKECMDSILKIRQDSEECFTCVALALAIAKSDGNLDKDEIAIVKDIASKLGVSTRELGI